MPPAKQRAARKPSSGRSPTSAAKTPPEVVNPIWLAKALGLSLIAALFCSWLTVCLLFYQGEWQLILHPSHTVNRTPASAELAFEPVRFDAAETGQPLLTGWWIPAQANAQRSGQLSFQAVPKYAALTVLYLHDGWGSLSDTPPALARLHQAGVNVFAIDYRGFGQSDASVHATEARMAQDTSAALDYLISVRHIPAASIVPYGVGIGASLAAGLSHAHPELPAVVLDNPNPDPTATALASRPSHVVPVRLLFREHFDIATPLATLGTPKLLIAGGPDSTNSASEIRSLQTLFRHAASPSLTVTLKPIHYEDDYQAALDRFLDQYVPATPGAQGR